jgi:LemA protein
MDLFVVTSIMVLVLIVLLAGIVIYTIVIYNGLVALKNNIDKSWSNIDVILKQRYDEIPKLVKVCSGYMKHERETLDAVVKARSMVNTAQTDAEKFRAQEGITQALRSLFAVVEQYPDLKADTIFKNLGARISTLEDQIADRRELFNESVNLYNIRTQQFPDVIIARFLNFAGRQLWEIDPAHREDVKIEF